MHPGYKTRTWEAVLDVYSEAGFQIKGLSAMLRSNHFEFSVQPWNFGLSGSTRNNSLDLKFHNCDPCCAI